MVPKASASLVTVATPVKTTRSDQRPPNKEERRRKAPKKSPVVGEKNRGLAVLHRPAS